MFVQSEADDPPTLVDHQIVHDWDDAIIDPREWIVQNVIVEHEDSGRPDRSDALLRILKHAVIVVTGVDVGEIQMTIRERLERLGAWPFVNDDARVTNGIRVIIGVGSFSEDLRRRPAP